MTRCIVCGKDAGYCVCDDCRGKTDLEKLCDDIAMYIPARGENPLWDEISRTLKSIYNFRFLGFAVADLLPSPRKEYRKIQCMAGKYSFVQKDTRKWLCNTAPACMDKPELSDEENARVKGLVLDAHFKDYRFEETEKVANDLLKGPHYPKLVYYTLIDYYTKTRRFDKASSIIVRGEKEYPNDSNYAYNKNKLQAELDSAIANKKEGKQLYLPAPKENREEIRIKFIGFLQGIGVEADYSEGVPKGKAPTPIPKDQYPAPVERRNADFSRFVAFDLETTGRSPKIDSIIEIGAIRVVDGKILESGEFQFQKFVKPYKKKLSEEITELTGIRPEDVADAGQMWEVTPEFLNFVGDDVLVGYNCMQFDSQFMVRAGRYSNIVIKNQYFDVMHYAQQFKKELGITNARISLGDLGKKVGVHNPEAHRALADAVTTARIFLKLKEMDGGSSGASVDDMLDDIDNW